MFFLWIETMVTTSRRLPGIMYLNFFNVSILVSVVAFAVQTNENLNFVVVGCANLHKLTYYKGAENFVLRFVVKNIKTEVHG